MLASGPWLRHRLGDGIGWRPLSSEPAAADRHCPVRLFRASQGAARRACHKPASWTLALTRALKQGADETHPHPSRMLRRGQSGRDAAQVHLGIKAHRSGRSPRPLVSGRKQTRVAARGLFQSAGQEPRLLTNPFSSRSLLRARLAIGTTIMAAVRTIIIDCYEVTLRS